MAKELRELASTLEQACQQAPCMSVAYPIVHDCADHLRLMAGWHEAVLRAVPEGYVVIKKDS